MDQGRFVDIVGNENLSVRKGRPARQAREAAAYTQLEQLTSLSEQELLKLHGIGPKALGLLRQALAEKG